MKHVTNGDQWKDHAVIESYVFEKISTFSRQQSSRDSTHVAPIICVLFSK